MATNVAITGGAGFIGSHLTDALVERGFSVSVIDTYRSALAYRNPAAVYHECSVTDIDQLTELFAGVDTVFHLAAISSVPYSIEQPLETHTVNVDGTVTALVAARTAGVRRFILASSAAVYGDASKLPLKESMAAEPTSPYGVHKQIGEDYCSLMPALYGLETVSLRYFNVYGPRQQADNPYAGVICRFLDRAAAGKALPVTGDGTQTRDFIHVHDVARANIMAMESAVVGSGERINIGSGSETSIRELATQIGGSVEYAPSRHEVARSCADISSAKEFLGWEPTISFSDGIAELVHQNES